MYGRSNLMHARNQYKSLELVSRIDGATPHTLVAILYDELLRSLDVLGAALRQQRDLRNETHARRASDILTALTANLDFDQGASVAQTLATVYRAMASQLVRVIASGDAEKLAELRDGVDTIATSWRRLAA
ncbi:MAG: flagellar protein FliS [Pseudomonadota bacterium]